MPEVLSTVKLRLIADAETEAILDSQSRMCNWLYNQLLDKANDLRDHFKSTQDETTAKTLYTKRGLRNLVPAIKDENPFLKTVHSSPLKNAALRLTDSIQTYQKSHKGKRKGSETGWPRFRSWSACWFSLFYDEPQKGFRLEGNSLRLSLGQGKDKVRYHVTLSIADSCRVLKNKVIRNCRIVKQQGIFYAVLTVARQLPEPKPMKKLLVIDPNHKNLGYGVNNFGSAIEIESPRWLKNYDRQIDEIKSKRDRCKKRSYQVDVLDTEGKSTGKKRWVPSRRWRHLNKALLRTLARRDVQVKTYCYTISNQLCKEYDCIAVGDYTPRGGGITRKMRRAMNNRSTIGQFKQILSWVAAKSGKHYCEYDEKGTTRTCHACDAVVPGGIKPNVRVWQCSNCEVIHHRDENSSINGMRKVLRNEFKDNSFELLVPSSGRVLVTKRCTWRVRPSGVRITSRGMDSNIIASAKKLNCLRGSRQSEIAYAQV